MGKRVSNAKGKPSRNKMYANMSYKAFIEKKKREWEEQNVLSHFMGLVKGKEATE